MHDTTMLNADDIADFLRENPAFFDEHADIFAEMAVPHPHEGRAISLGERQILTLRERMHALERRLATLTHNAKDSERIVAGIQEWSLELLAETDAARLPEHIAAGLARIFDVPSATLRVWGCANADCPGDADAAWRQPVSEDIELFTASLVKPYCGTDTEFEAAAWLETVPASLALVPLRTPRGNTIGLLALGSDDAARFAPDMATDFLAHIGALAGAALSRLMPRA